MNIIDANYNLVGKILNRYKGIGIDQIEIFLTKQGYQKGIGNGRCWAYIDEEQVNHLISSGVLKLLDDPVIHPKSSPNLAKDYSIKIYHGNFLLPQAISWFEDQTIIKNINEKSIHPLLFAVEKVRSKAVKRMTKLLVQDKRVPNYLLARCIKPTVLDNKNESRRLSKTDYKRARSSYDRQINNRLRKLRECWKSLSYTVSFKSEYSELVKI